MLGYTRRQVEGAPGGNSGTGTAGEIFHGKNFRSASVLRVQFAFFVKRGNSLRRKSRHATTGKVIIQLGAKPLQQAPCFGSVLAQGQVCLTGFVPPLAYGLQIFTKCCGKFRIQAWRARIIAHATPPR